MDLMCVDSTEQPSPLRTDSEPPSDATDPPRNLTGFARPGYAAAAARKGHQLGPPHCYQWTADEARRRGAEGGAASVRSGRAHRWTSETARAARLRQMETP